MRDGGFGQSPGSPPTSMTVPVATTLHFVESFDPKQSGGGGEVEASL